MVTYDGVSYNGISYIKGKYQTVPAKIPLTSSKRSGPSMLFAASPSAPALGAAAT
jgi:hypothetical protein